MEKTDKQAKEINLVEFIRDDGFKRILRRGTSEYYKARINELEHIISENTVRIIGHVDHIKELEKQNADLRAKLGEVKKGEGPVEYKVHHTGKGHSR